MRYSQKRTYAWSPSIGYSVGLVASDGCLQRDGRHVDLTSTDLEQLNNFSIALERQFTVSQKKNGNGKLAHRIQFSDVGYYDFLLAAGLAPAKSKTLAALIIPDNVYADFLRGVFDGDGTTYGYKDPRWTSSFMYYVAFASASITFLEFLREQNYRLAYTSAGSLRRSGDAYILSYAKADSKKLSAYMYYSANCLSLTRKRIKLEAFTKAL